MLQHVALEVREADVPECVGFWRLLGFHEIEPPETLRGATTWVQRGGTQVHLLHTDDPVVPQRGHCAVVVDDFDGAVEVLRDAGFECDERRRHWGAARCFVRDPAGHRVELMAAPPPGR